MPTLPNIWEASDRDLVKYGILPGHHAKGAFAFVDPRPSPPDGYPDGETSDGIWLTRHPDAMLRDCPAIWNIVRIWRSPISKELPYEVFKTLTQHEVCAWNELMGSYVRSLKRGPGK